jgi:hypothetical protein
MRQRLLFVALLGTAAAALLAEDGRFETTIPIPRSSSASLDWTNSKCSVRDLTLRNYPERDDIQDARDKDPNDKSWLWWEFRLDNRGPSDCKVRLWVEVLDKAGNVLKASDRSDTVDAGEIDDAIRVSTLIKTLDIVDAPRVRIRAQIIPK